MFSGAPLKRRDTVRARDRAIALGWVIRSFYLIVPRTTICLDQPVPYLLRESGHGGRKVIPALSMSIMSV
jgi:hypothetical protein